MAQRALQSEPNLLMKNLDTKLLHKNTKKYLGINVKSRYTLANLLAIPLVYLMAAMMTNFTGMQTVFLLRSEDYYAVSQDNLGTINSDLIFYSQLGQIVITLFVGQIFDTFGRRNTMVITLFFSAILVFLQPIAAPSVFPWLVIIRIGIAICLNGPFSSPLVSDYVKKDSRGAAVSLQTLGYITGDLVAALVLFNFTKTLDYTISFGITSITLIILSFCLFFMITEPRTHLLVCATDELVLSEEIGVMQEEVYYNPENKRPLRLIWREVREAISKSIALQICLIGTFLIRNAGLIVGVYTTVWVTSFVKSEDPSKNQGSFVLASEEEAKSIIQNTHVVGIIVKVILFQFFGVLTDKLPFYVMIPLSYFVRMFGILGFLALKNPGSYHFYIVYSVIEAGILMENISIESLFSKNLPKNIRGTMNSI